MNMIQRTFAAIAVMLAVAYQRLLEWRRKNKRIPNKTVNFGQFSDSKSRRRRTGFVLEKK